MFKYTIKRLLQSVVTVLIVVTIVFLLMRMLPTDYFFTEDQLMKFTPEQKEEQLQAAGLLDPMPKQLVRYYGQLLKFDFGESRRIQNGVDVVSVIGDKFTISMKLGCTALVISLFVGSLVSYSLVLAFGSKVLGLPSLYSTRNPSETSILPIVCLSLASIASYALWTRRYMVDELNKDYIKLARVKGTSSAGIMIKHVFKNAFVPLAQYVPASFLYTIGGSLLVERFFSVPGMGPLLTDAIVRYDVNVVQTLVVLYAVLGTLGVFLGDILMMLLDPRIKLTGKGGTR